MDNDLIMYIIIGILVVAVVGLAYAYFIKPVPASNILLKAKLIQDRLSRLCKMHLAHLAYSPTILLK